MKTRLGCHKITTSRGEVLKYDREVLSARDERDLAVIETRLEQKFSGGMAGLGHATHLPTEYADGTGNLMCLERFEGSVNGRCGAFVL